MSLGRRASYPGLVDIPRQGLRVGADELVVSKQDIDLGNNTIEKNEVG